MQVRINGEDCILEGALSITSLLSRRNLKPESVVVEHNGRIVPREEWGLTLLGDNDVLEIVAFMCGG
jgi:thiamine biosynthesis protein ThiS